MFGMSAYDPSLHDSMVLCQPRPLALPCDKRSPTRCCNAHASTQREVSGSPVRESKGAKVSKRGEVARFEEKWAPTLLLP
jgi:hypothetical protein